MRKSSLGSLVAMAGIALAGISDLAVAEGTKPRPQTGRRRQLGRNRYPEQSTRQEMRAQRRAQGGPGITLNPRTFEYEPRA